ncbi:MAG: hypothetical protein WA843_01725 [Candidatus Saccharimonadales bacterium]
MTQLSELGLAETAGVDARIKIYSPPRTRFHQEGVVDMVFAGYLERETKELIPVGRVVTTPYEQSLENEHGRWTAATSQVLGIVGLDTIYKRAANAIYLPEYRHLARYHHEGAILKELRSMQQEAGHLVLAHLGLQPPRYGLRRRRGVKLS